MAAKLTWSATSSAKASSAGPARATARCRSTGWRGPRGKSARCLLDTELLRSYGLGPAATELLTCLALWEIRSLLSGGLRLRTACDLELDGDIQVRRGDLQLPQVADLSARIAELIAECGEEFPDGPLTVAWKG